MQGQSYYSQGWGNAFSVYRSAPNLKVFRTYPLARAFVKQKEKEARKQTKKYACYQK